MLRAERLSKGFRSGNGELKVLDRLDLEVTAGEMVAILGESGSGKSTLLQVLGLLDNFSDGEVYFEGVSYSGIGEADKGKLRNRNFGYVWQLHHLLPEFSALENVSMPLRIRGLSESDADVKAAHWLTRVGLKNRTSNRAGELSGGEQQRASLARALVGEPKVLLADEPTGSLDARTGDKIADLMDELHRDCKLTTVLVTHNLALARRCDRVLKLESGQLHAVSMC